MLSTVRVRNKVSVKIRRICITRVRNTSLLDDFSKLHSSPERNDRKQSQYRDFVFALFDGCIDETLRNSWWSTTIVFWASNQPNFRLWAVHTNCRIWAARPFSWLDIQSRENLMKAKEKRMVGLRLIQTRLPDRIKPIRLDPLESRIGFLCLAHLRFRLIPPFPLNQPYLEISY